MRCHICKKWVKAADIEKHLRKRHGGSYGSAKKYIFTEHQRAYGFDHAKHMVNSLFKKRGMKATIPGMIVGFITLMLFAVLANVFYPLVVTIMNSNGGTDPSFVFIMNVAFIVIGIGIIIGIYQDATRGTREQVVYGGP